MWWEGLFYWLSATMSSGGDRRTRVYLIGIKLVTPSSIIADFSGRLSNLPLTVLPDTAYKQQYSSRGVVINFLWISDQLLQNNDLVEVFRTSFSRPDTSESLRQGHNSSAVLVRCNDIWFDRHSSNQLPFRPSSIFNVEFYKCVSVTWSHLIWNPLKCLRTNLGMKQLSCFLTVIWWDSNVLFIVFDGLVTLFFFFQKSLRA